MKMKTKDLIPQEWQDWLGITFWTHERLLYFGKRNLKAMRASWRRREKDINDSIKHKQQILDIVQGGHDSDKNLELKAFYARQRKINEEINLNEHGGFLSATFLRCAHCTFCNHGLNEPGDCTLKPCGLRDINARCYWMKGKKQNRELVTYLEARKNAWIIEKKRVSTIIRILSKAIEEANDDKPYLPLARQADHFKIDSEAIFFAKTVDSNTVRKLAIKGRFDADYTSCEDVNDNNIAYDVLTKSPRFMTRAELNYLRKNPEFRKYWVGINTEERRSRKKLLKSLA